jgi:3-hydroxyisobutyrate dehydrogenase
MPQRINLTGSCDIVCIESDLERMLALRVGVWVGSRGRRQYSSNVNSTNNNGNKAVVGFIGLGEMGFRMAKNLLKNQMTVVCYDVRGEPLDALEAEFNKAYSSPGQGLGPVRRASSPAQVASYEGIDTIITMLPEPKHVSLVYRDGAHNLFAAARPGTMFIDASTIDPITARTLAQEAAGKQLTMLDAPVSGGIGGAEAGTLTFMVGAPDLNTFERASQILRLMGKNIVHCGGAGTGQVAKVCNNLLLGISMAGVSEAFNLGQRLGMDPKILAQVINTSSGRCWSSDTYNPVPGLMPNVPASRDYNGGFGVDLMAKDLSLAVSAAHSVKSPLPLGAAAQQIYNQVSNHGLGKKDFGVVYKWFEKK